MSALQKQNYLTEKAYLEFEEASDFKHEYVAGLIYAMAGATENHNLISGNIFFQLRGASRGKGGNCKIFTSDMKLRTDNGDFYYYPDVMLTCHDDDNNSLYKNKPCFIAEVLSKSTAKIDRREKWQTYRKIPSLRYYLLVDSLKQKIDYFIRNDEGDWFCAELESHETLTIECENYQAVLTLADIYEDVSF